MDTASAFMMGRMSRDNRVRVFDWHKAAQRIKEVKPRIASAGLRGDWEWTGGTIYTADGIPDLDDSYTYLSSTWAIPELNMDGYVEECWAWQDESLDWDAKTFWPDSAKEILGVQVKGTVIDAEFTVIGETKELEYKEEN